MVSVTDLNLEVFHTRQCVIPVIDLKSMFHCSNRPSSYAVSGSPTGRAVERVSDPSPGQLARHVYVGAGRGGGRGDSESGF